MKHILFTFSIGFIISAFTLTLPGYAQIMEYKRALPILKTDKTVLGVPFFYPKDSPSEISATVITLMPGKETGWHTHHVPLFAYVLEGEITVNYAKIGKRIYKKGDAIMEAIDHAHNGVNTGSTSVQILTVFLSSKTGIKTEKVQKPNG